MKAQAKLRRAITAIIDALIPPVCPITRDRVDETGLLSSAAWNDLPAIAPPFCACCGEPFPHDMGGEPDMLCGFCIQDRPLTRKMRAALVYADGARSPLLAFKHADATHLARSFSRMMASAGAELLQDADLLVPVPLHRWRLLQRRYNQSALLAQDIARLTGVPCLPDALLRVKRTPSQGHKKRAERIANLKNSVRINPRHASAIAGKHIIVVDDVITTGATMNACAKALLDAGAKTVDGLAIARVQWSV